MLAAAHGDLADQRPAGRYLVICARLERDVGASKGCEATLLVDYRLEALVDHRR